MIEALDIQVRGIVQGVGFRPFIYRLARHYLVNGWVLNSREGVFIHAEGEGKLLDEFVMEISDNAPAAAEVREIELHEVPLQDCKTFEIRESLDEEPDKPTLVSADLATCADCTRELFDPDNRRYRYPFINCTNCGPRFTIIDSLPYDRPATSMASFAMCPTCAREYADPVDRRFHAQPDACWECGPHISWKLAGSDEVSWGRTRSESDALFAQAVTLLANGGIVAVKGLGGFHLVCDAANESALAALRARKHRDGKALAVMAPDVDTARIYCEVDAAEAGQLTSAARPIVLLHKKAGIEFARGLADALPELGVMLPATPVQHLLMHDFAEATGKSLLVMTSGNRHDEPIAIDDGEAYVRLADIADAFLGNDRPILARYDDSVVRVLHIPAANPAHRSDALQFIRRARGYAPVPLGVPPVTTDEASSDSGASDVGTVFAAGSQQKNTFAFARGEQAFVSQHIGDVEDADTFDAWFDAKERFERLFELKPQLMACDLHPEYLTSKWARERASKDGVPLVEVQHHHAHIAAVLGEHALEGPVCGIAFDGTGAGADGAIWGGEVLLANQADYERFANFAYVPMPGGAAAIKNPLRMAFGVLWAFDLLDHPAARTVVEALGSEADVCEHMVEHGLNTPLTSSVGRLFDAVSAILGVCTHPSYEGEAAVLLDAARCAWAASGEPHADDSRYAIGIAKNSATPESTAHDTSVVLLDPAPLFEALLDDMQAGVAVGAIAQRFHDAMVDVIVQVAELVRGLYGIDVVALSGGVFMNRYLVEQSCARLGDAGFTVALGANLPPNDGCISYGQAVVARRAR